MNGYIAYYRGRSIEVHSDTSLHAQEQAAVTFKARKRWEVTVMLAELNGVPVIHSAPTQFNASLKASHKRDGRAGYHFPQAGPILASFGDEVIANEAGEASCIQATHIYCAQFLAMNNLVTKDPTPVPAARDPFPHKWS